MRGQDYTLNLNLSTADDPYRADVLHSIWPISRGPYGGDDVLMVMDNLCGKYYVVRATLTGEHLSKSEMVEGEEAALNLVNELKEIQNRKDCNTVSGNGRWSVE